MAVVGVNDHRQTLHAVEAADEDQIERRFAEDPWARAGRLAIGSILSWAFWLDFRRLGR